MQVKFWGTRGSIAKPGPATERYGGNTSCVAVRSNSGVLIVLDCGTGAHDLGRDLTAGQVGATDGHLLISHTHWDHIQGIPFFAPFFIAGNTWHIYGPGGLSQSIKSMLAGQMEHTYFPISLDQFAAKIIYHDLVEGAFSIGDVKIVARYLNHPALTLGYRIEVDGASLAYCCDHEPHSVSMASGEAALTGMDRRYGDFVAGADLVIHDAQYTASEYPGKIGWGHSPVEYAVRVCRDVGVKRLALTHYDPARSDADVDKIIEEVHLHLLDLKSQLAVVGAAEGLVLELASEPGAVPDTPKQNFEATTAVSALALARPVLLRLADSSITALLCQALDAEGVRYHILGSDNELLLGMREHDPAMVLVEHDPPLIDGIETTRAIRRGERRDAVQVPVVLVTSLARSAVPDNSIGTDWLFFPFSLSYARTRIRSWVLRAACRWVRAGIPGNEVERLAALSGLAILDTPAEEKFDRLTRVAAAALDVPIALISLVDSDRQWFKSCFGLDVRETSRDVAFCAHVVHQKEEMVVRDTFLDDRFADNPLVVEGPRIRAYAGVPLVLDDGHCIGTLCVVDNRPRDFSEVEMTALRDLRDLALEEIKRM